MQEWSESFVLMKKHPYAPEESEKIEKAQYLLSKQIEYMAAVFFLRPIAWFFRRRLRHLDENYFKPKVIARAQELRILRIHSNRFHFQTFRILCENEELLKRDPPKEFVERLH